MNLCDLVILDRISASTLEHFPGQDVVPPLPPRRRRQNSYIHLHRASHCHWPCSVCSTRCGPSIDDVHRILQRVSFSLLLVNLFNMFFARWLYVDLGFALGVRPRCSARSLQQPRSRSLVNPSSLHKSACAVGSASRCVVRGPPRVLLGRPLLKPRPRRPLLQPRRPLRHYFTRTLNHHMPSV